VWRVSVTARASPRGIMQSHTELYRAAAAAVYCVGAGRIMAKFWIWVRTPLGFKRNTVVIRIRNADYCGLRLTSLEVALDSFQ